MKYFAITIALLLASTTFANTYGEGYNPAENAQNIANQELEKTAREDAEKQAAKERLRTDNNILNTLSDGTIELQKIQIKKLEIERDSAKKDAGKFKGYVVVVSALLGLSLIGNTYLLKRNRTK